MEIMRGLIAGVVFFALYLIVAVSVLALAQYAGLWHG